MARSRSGSKRRASWCRHPARCGGRRRPGLTGGQAPLRTIEPMAATSRSATAAPRQASGGTAPLAYFWGDDAFGLEGAVEAFRTDAARFPEGAPARWRPGQDGPETGRSIGELIERIGTGSLFGDGTLVVVGGLGALVRRGVDRDRFVEALGQVAPGNGLAVVDETDSGKKDPPS